MQLVLSGFLEDGEWIWPYLSVYKKTKHKIWGSFQCADHNISQTEDVWFRQTPLDAVSLTLWQIDVKTCCLNS